MDTTKNTTGTTEQIQFTRATASGKAHTIACGQVRRFRVITAVEAQRLVDSGQECTHCQPGAWLRMAAEDEAEPQRSTEQTFWSATGAPGTWEVLA